MVSKMVDAVMPNQRCSSAQREHKKDQPCGLEPERIESPANGKNQRLSPGQQRIEQAVFLYNGLESVLYVGNFRHFGYCSPKIGVSLQKVKRKRSCRHPIRREGLR